MEAESDVNPWHHDIRMILKDGSYPEYSKDEKTLRRLTCHFFLSAEVLYKIWHDSVLLRCVDASEANKITSEIHKRHYVLHMSIFILARKILRQRYYCLIMENGCFKHVNKCHLCQSDIDKVNQPPTPLHNLTSPWPFSMWGYQCSCINSS